MKSKLNWSQSTTLFQKEHEQEISEIGTSMVKKSSRFVLNLEKYNGTQSKIRKPISGNVEIVDGTEISKELYQTIYGKASVKSETLGHETPKLSDTQIKLCEKEIIPP